MTNASNTISQTQASAVYNIEQWGGGYFVISKQGDIDVLKHNKSVALKSIIEQAQAQGLRLPLLLRFSHVLHDRVEKLNAAFGKALKEYKGCYTPVYPVKVNQQRRVVEEIISGFYDANPIGLEAGSKPELLAVLAKAPSQSLVVCNGYKDAEFIRLALLGQSLGHQVFIVIEKLSELKHIIEQSQQMGIKPRLGLRVRLFTKGESKWQNSGGEKAKFGLTASQILHAIEICQTNNMSDCIEMLHFHLGSQITDIAAIERGVTEAARYYVSLRVQGLPIGYFDIGGGLGIDYEGTASRNYFSMNYSLDDYAQAVVSMLAGVCAQESLPMPHIISESGRALTAHHAVLISNVVEHERVKPLQYELDAELTQSLSSGNLGGLLRLKARLLSRQVVDCQNAHSVLMQEIQTLHQLFVEGELDMEVYAQVDTLYQQCLRLLQYRLPRGDSSKANSSELAKLKAHIHEVLADKIFLNFSVFQSTPDVWGINQVFPVLPLQGLLRRPDARAVIHDITCDSDGKIKYYVDGAGVETTLPIPENLAADEYIGIFLVGAYQEILGDMHNLFGDTDSADVIIFEDGRFELTDIIKGDTVSDVLEYVNYNADDLLSEIVAKFEGVEHTNLDTLSKEGVLKELSDLLQSYTYLNI